MTELALVVGPGRALAAVIAAVPYVGTIRTVSRRVVVAGGAGSCPSCIPGGGRPGSATTIGHRIERGFTITTNEIVAESAGFNGMAGNIRAGLGRCIK